MTEEFANAAELMGRVLGAVDYPFVVIEHPISSAAERELVERARTAARACVEQLTRNASNRSDS